MWSSPWGGSEELWSQAASRLKQAGHDVQASVEFRAPLPDKVAELAKQGVRIETHFTRVGDARRLWNRLLLKSLRSRRRLKRFKPDLVIISQGENKGGFHWAKTCREAGIPYAILVQCNNEYAWFEEHVDADAVASYTPARRIFCVSRHNLELLRMQVGEPLLNSEVAWNPYNVSAERAPAWPDESGGWRLACVARVDLSAKGQDLLLQTLARPEWRDRPVELNLYGAGPHEPALRHLAAMLRLNNVHFRGHVNDIRAIWAQNHLLVLPSRYEGLPLALVEAMWCGRPAVVTDVGGNAELCVDNETGFVAPASTLSSFSQTLQKAWDRREEWPRLGQAARSRVESRMPRDPVGSFCERLQALAGERAGQELAA